jgi:hypothetical protein
MRLSICLILLSLSVHAAASAAPEIIEQKMAGECLRMTIAASPIASFGGQARQHYRISFENFCDTSRVVYWCAEHPTKPLTATSVCSARTGGGFAAPLYAVNRQREFQWTFPLGTLIRYVDCNDSTYPTSDFRCAPPGPRR